MMSSKLLVDRITIEPAGGGTYPDVKAQVNGNTIIMFHDDKVPIAKGDTITRRTPGGVERYIVEDPGFRQGLGNIPPFYEMKVRRA